MSMVIETPRAERVVDDYDVAMLDGMLIQLTLDVSLGDVWTESPDLIQVTLSEKASPAGDAILPMEVVTIYKKNLLSVRKRSRTVTELSKAEKAEWQQTVKELTQVVH